MSSDSYQACEEFYAYVIYAIAGPACYHSFPFIYISLRSPFPSHRRHAPMSLKGTYSGLTPCSQPSSKDDLDLSSHTLILSLTVSGYELLTGTPCTSIPTRIILRFPWAAHPIHTSHASYGVVPLIHRSVDSRYHPAGRRHHTRV
jgi:hypothetical protein